LRKVPNTPEEHYLENDFTTLFFTLGLFPALSQAVTAVSKKTKVLKTSLFPFATNALNQLVK